MQSELKYRGWCPKKQKMFYVPDPKNKYEFTIYQPTYGNVGIRWRIGKAIDWDSPISDLDFVSNTSGGILMNCTGLHTENTKGNKLIYVGDVVKGYEPGYAEVGIKIKGWDYSRIGVVIQMYGNTYYSLDGVNPHGLLMYLQKIEILGNKYENPELLKQLK